MLISFHSVPSFLYLFVFISLPRRFRFVSIPFPFLHYLRSPLPFPSISPSLLRLRSVHARHLRISQKETAASRSRQQLTPRRHRTCRLPKTAWGSHGWNNTALPFGTPADRRDAACWSLRCGDLRPTLPATQVSTWAKSRCQELGAARTPYGARESLLLAIKTLHSCCWMNVYFHVLIKSSIWL